MNDILFSIIVPVYNVQQYLRQCLDSIINQTYRNLEIVLVDDGSTDDCPSICDEYASKDSRIKVVHKPNGGLVSARQAGAKIVTGEYVLNVDSDDWVSLDELEKLYEVAAKHHPDIICFGFTIAQGEKRFEHELPYRKGFYEKADIEREIFPSLLSAKDSSYFQPAIWAKAIKRELYCPEQLSLDTRIKISEDSACTLPCIYKANSLYVLRDSLYYYRKNDDSMTAYNKKLSWDGPELVAKHIANRIDLKQFDFQNQLYRKIIHELYFVIMSYVASASSMQEAKKEINSGLGRDLYQETINKVSFQGSIKGQMLAFALKHKFYFLFKLV